MPKGIQNALWVIGIFSFLYLAAEINAFEIDEVPSQTPPIIPPAINRDPFDSVVVNVGKKPISNQAAYIAPVQEYNPPPASRISPKTPLSQKLATKPMGKSDFVHSDDYRTVRYQGNEIHLSITQAYIVKQLHESRSKGINSVHQDALLEGAEVYSRRLRDVFKGSPAWKTLVIPSGKGFFLLNA